MNAYLTKNRQDSLSELSGAREFVEKQRRSASVALVNSENLLLQFKQRNRFTELEKSRDSQFARVDALQNRLGELSSKVKVYAAQTEAIQNQLQTEPAAIASNLESGNTVRSAIREELRKLQVERIGQAQRFGPKNRSLIAVDAQIHKLEEQLLQQPEFLTTRTSTSNQVRTELRVRLASLLTDSVAAAAEHRQVSAALATEQRDLAKFPEYEVTLARLMRQHDVAGENERMLSAKLADLELREKAYRPSARIIESTSLPGAPIRPRKAQNIVVFALFGLFLGVCLGLAQEYLDDRINSVEQANGVLRLPSLGIIPMMPEAAVRLLPLSQHPHPALESYRLLRTNIQFASIDEPVKTLLVTSPSPGEGKTTTSLNLAFAMAMDGKRVILVDTDLRRPSLHERLELPSRLGLTDVLLGDALLEDVVTPLQDVPNLSVVMAGSLPPNPSELLNSRKFHAFCTQLADRADIVIFDSSPILIAADGPILASQMDSTILVIENGRTRKSITQAAMLTLEQARARVLGVVHNKLKDSLKEGYDYCDYLAYSSTEGAEHSRGEGRAPDRNKGLVPGKLLRGFASARTSKLRPTEGGEDAAHDRDA
jgi:capsular exopolysaccharide synthesis family protein